MKLIQQLLDSLFLLLNEKEVDNDEKLKKLDVFYKEYLGEEKDFYYQSSLDEILKYFEDEYGAEELPHRVEMLSEILYQESMLMPKGEGRNELLQQTLSVFIHLENNSNTYSVVRKGKIDTIKEEITQR